MSLKQDLSFWFSRALGYPFCGPEALQISLTYRCNLKCRVCRLKQLLPQEEELSLAQLTRLGNEAASLGIKEVILTGGEPLLREDFFELCRVFRSCLLKTIVTTNGALIDRACARELAACGVNHVHFSVDGLQGVHDFLRGPGTFEKITQAIGYLNELRSSGHFFSLGVACTVMDCNVGELSGIAQWADDLKVDIINFQALMRDNADFSAPGPSGPVLARERLSILKEEFHKIKTVPRRTTRLYEEPPLELLYKYCEGSLSVKDWVCFGGFKTMFICFAKKTPYVYSCHGLCGNLDQTSLKKAWRSKEAFRLRQQAKTCQHPCLQSCYSKVSAQSLGRLGRLKTFSRLSLMA